MRTRNLVILLLVVVLTVLTGLIVRGCRQEAVPSTGTPTWTPTASATPTWTPSPTASATPTWTPTATGEPSILPISGGVVPDKAGDAE